MKRLLVFALILIAIPVQVSGFTVSAMVDRNRISVNDSLSLRVVVQGGDALVDTSVITDFKVIPRGTSTSVSIINGDYSKSIIYQYLLMPKKQGSLKIPPLPVTLEGEISHTEAINVAVNEISATDEGSGDLFVRATLSEKVLVPGQQIIYTFRLYSAVQIANATLKQPEFTGFLAKEVGKENFGEVINGKSYEVTQVAYALIAEKPGKVEIEPSVVTCDIPLSDPGNSSGDPFFSNRFFSMGRSETRRFATESFKVEIKPMPVHDGDVQFTGLVGRFSLGAELDKSSVASGDSLTLTLTVSGVGNIMDAQVPGMRVPEAFKSYEDAPEEKITLTPKGFQGEKIFRRALVPVKPGSFSLDPVKLCYFNTDTGSYEILSTPVLNLSVTPSNNGSTPISPGAANGEKTKAEKQSVEFTGNDILALKEGSRVLIPHKEIPLRLFTAFLIFPFLMLLIFRIVVLVWKKEDSPSSLMDRRARLCLKKAESKNISQEEFFRYLYMVLVSKVLARGGRSGETLTERDLSDILLKAGHGEEKINQAIAILNEIESARYSRVSFDMNMKNDLLKRTKGVIKNICLMLVCLGWLSFSPDIGRADDSGTLFLEGINLYKAGMFQDAAEKFELVAESGIKNGELYYNIGNAHLKGGELGSAILWYERAARLIPLDPDLKYNLDYARGLVPDEAGEKTMDIPGLIFFWEKYLPPWIFQYGALALWCAFTLHAGVRMARKKRVFTLAGAVLFVLSLLMVSTVFFNYYRQSSDSHAVIIASEASVRSGNSDDATELFILHAGTKVRVERRKKDFLRIAFSRDKVGWVRADLVDII